MDVLNSPAVAILCELERDGFSIQLGSDNALVIAPRPQLTPERMQLIAAHKPAICLLVRCCELGVTWRRDVMRAALDAADSNTLPGFRASADVANVAGLCFSCGAHLVRCRHGRCWRCSLAWRLAARLPVPLNLSVDDEAQVA